MLVAPSGGDGIGGGAAAGGGGNAAAPAATTTSTPHQHHPNPGSGLRRQSKTEIADAFVRSLRERGGLDVDAPGVAASIRSHFQLLPSRYALDVNLASLDVLNHKRLLDSARADPSAVSFQVRPVDVALSTASASGGSILMRPASTSAERGSGGGNGTNGSGLDRAPSFSASDSLLAEAAAAGARAARPRATAAAALPRPAFGSSPNLQALVLEAEAADARPEAAFYEVTIASVDQPKLLSRLSEALGDLNLNICEAHAFNTLDRFSLDVFVVNGWAGETADELEDVLSERLAQLPPPGANSPPRGAGNAAGAAYANASADSQQQPGVGTLTPIGGGASPAGTSPSGGGGAGGGLEGEGGGNAANGLVPTSALPRPPPPPDDFELDAAEVVCHERVAAGAFGDLYRGTYCGTDVAVKILRNVATDTAQFAEFLQEVHIMRKVRHRNVVQFIGACTQRPNLCIVFEYLPGGSVFDWMRARGPPALLALLKMGAEVARGMDYLHKRRVVHRDLKAANLLLDDAGCVKIADFGVARLLDAGGGVMTAETGTYRWMAPEIITHAPYDEKADVYSYGILLWELLTGKVPYAELTPLQAAVGVVQKGLRPTIPAGCPARLAEVMRACWTRRPEDRPDFEAIKAAMEALYMEARAEEERRAAAAAQAAAAAAAAAGGGAGSGGQGSGGSSGAAASGGGGGGGLLSKLRRSAGGGGGGGGGAGHNNQPPPPPPPPSGGAGGGNAAPQA